MKDLDVDDRVLEDEHELDPQHSAVAELEEEEGREDVTPARDGHAREVSHFQAIAGRVAAIFEGHDLGDDLEKTAPELSDEERLALELLRECVSGRDERTHRIVYAERRIEMLELALATLQPAFALALEPELGGELRGAYDQLVEEVTGLREKLDKLDAAQEELLALRFEQEVEAGKPDDEDKPGEPPAPAEEGEPMRPSTLYGTPDEKPVEKPPAKSTVYDPD